jgi:hypothetical protein
MHRTEKSYSYQKNIKERERKRKRKREKEREREDRRKEGRMDRCAVRRFSLLQNK